MVLSMNRWIGKVAVVTGASAGCGAEIAKQLVDSGLIVAGLARRKDKLNDLAKELEGKNGKFYSIQADISKEEDILKAFLWIKQNLGTIHILINNAGIAKSSTYLDGKTDDWLAVFQTNVIGLSIATREVVKEMKANNINGHIIHINSVLGHYVNPVPFVNVYPATKFAVTALTEVLRQELISMDSKIKVTSVSPGPINTKFGTANIDPGNEHFQEFFEKLSKLEPEDVADAVSYVLSTPPHVQIHELIIRPVGELL